MIKTGIQLTEEELSHMEAFCASPVYKTFQKVVENYKATVQQELLTAKDLQQVFQCQGRIIGVQAIENLPKIHAIALQELRKRRQGEQAAE